jgi:hypothetical protein
MVQSKFHTLFFSIYIQHFQRKASSQPPPPRWYVCFIYSPLPFTGERERGKKQKQKIEQLNSQVYKNKIHHTQEK